MNKIPNSHSKSNPGLNLAKTAELKKMNKTQKKKGFALWMQIINYWLVTI